MNVDQLVVEAELLAIDFRNMYVQQGKQTPARTGMHASAILQPESEWCAREQVLHHLFPDQAEQGDGWQPWDWKKKAIFETGWDLHRRWQKLFLEQGNVVYSPVPPEYVLAHSQHLKLIDGQWCAPELDLTHYDEWRNLYFSPDAIINFGGQRYVVEIKGIKQEAYQYLTDDLEQACVCCETVHKAREQCNLYMHLLGLQRGVILVENKNTCDFRLWVIEYEFKRYQPYRDRIYRVKGATQLVKSQGLAMLPVRCCQSAADSRAKRCPMRSACFIERN
ncbi:MAG TPA: hypothetical protein VFN23_20900 [Ktedonobacteraceae bacterium]|nr:hypothetical protein [Ktedonobacteraceae bacterium]